MVTFIIPDTFDLSSGHKRRRLTFFDWSGRIVKVLFEPQGRQNSDGRFFLRNPLERGSSDADQIAFPYLWIDYYDPH